MKYPTELGEWKADKRIKLLWKRKLRNPWKET